MSRVLRAYRDLESARDLEMPEIVDDKILEAMDELWFALTQDERDSLTPRLHRCPHCNYSRPFTEWPADEPCASCRP